MNNLYRQSKKLLVILRIDRIYSGFLVFANFVRYFGLTKGMENFICVISAKGERSEIKKIDIFGNTLIIRGGSSDPEVCIQHFGRRELLDISYPNDIKKILDFGANIGVSATVFRHLFPTADILAVEMNQENFKILKENFLNDKKTYLVEGAVWSVSGEIDQIDVGIGEWALRVGSYPGTIVSKVRSFTFSELCTMYQIDKVDVLKMDIEGAEVDVLGSSWRDILGRTRLLILEVHDWIPGCTQAIAKIIGEANYVFNLEVSYSGEFTVIRNLDLI
jgi:FkbM family methyltransferase